MKFNPPPIEYIEPEDSRMLIGEGYYSRPFIQRDDHGAILHPAVGLTRTMLDDVQDMLATAVVKRQLPVPYSVNTRQEAQSVSHHVVDLFVAQQRLNAALIQVRMSRQDKSTGVESERRRYVLLVNFDNTFYDVGMCSFRCEGRAWKQDFLGLLVAQLFGQGSDDYVEPKWSESTAITVLAQDSDGTLSSVFDGMEYLKSVWYSQVSANGCWGNYCFRDVDVARRYARLRKPFTNGQRPGRDLVLCKATIAGQLTKLRGGMVVAPHLSVGEILGKVDD